MHDLMEYFCKRKKPLKNSVLVSKLSENKIKITIKNSLCFKMPINPDINI